MRSNNDASGAEVYQRRWLEESGQWLKHVHRVHLALASGKWQVASGKPVLQKKLPQNNSQQEVKLSKKEQI